MQNFIFALFSIIVATAGCRSYEDVFNRNLNSTGIYVTNSGSNTVSMFAADPESGILNDLGTVAAGTSPVHVAVNSAGTFAYVVNSGSDDVYVYAIDKETRKLTFKSSASAGDNPRMIALHATKNFAYVVNENDDTISGYTLDSTTGAMTAMAGSPFASGAATPRTLAVYGGTNSYLIVADSGTNQVRLFDINATTGVISANAIPAANLSAGALPLGISVTGGNAPYIYAPCANGDIEYFALAQWALNPTGKANIAAGTSPVFVAVNSDRTTAFVSNAGSGNISVFSMASGALTAAGTVTACTTPAQIHINSSNFAYLVCNGENKVNAYSVAGASLNLVGSYSTGPQPTSVSGY